MHRDRQEAVGTAGEWQNPVRKELTLRAVLRNGPGDGRERRRGGVSSRKVWEGR